LVNVSAKRRPRALVINAVRPVTNIFWVLYFTLLPSVGVLYAAFIPKAGRGKLAHFCEFLRTHLLGSRVNKSKKESRSAMPQPSHQPGRVKCPSAPARKWRAVGRIEHAPLDGGLSPQPT
jgi:hypothetical protein